MCIDVKKPNFNTVSAKLTITHHIVIKGTLVFPLPCRFAQDELTTVLNRIGHIMKFGTIRPSIIKLFILIL